MIKSRHSTMRNIIAIRMTIIIRIPHTDMILDIVESSGTSKIMAEYNNDCKLIFLCHNSLVTVFRGSIQIYHSIMLDAHQNVLVIYWL